MTKHERALLVATANATLAIIRALSNEHGYDRALDYKRDAITVYLAHVDRLEGTMKKGRPT